MIPTDEQILAVIDEDKRTIADLQAKLQQAEAMCAEMRDCIEALQEWEWNMPDHLVGACSAALSATCGQGWLSPEKARVLTEALELLMDCQNGPPLVTWEKQWTHAMELSKQALAAAKQP